MNTVDFSSFLPLVLVFAAMYFFVIRPQSKKAKEHKAMLDGLQKKDAVVTNGGLLGTVHSISDREIKLELAPGIVVTVLRAMIAEKVTSMHSTPSAPLQPKATDPTPKASKAPKAKPSKTNQSPRTPKKKS